MLPTWVEGGKYKLPGSNFVQAVHCCVCFTACLANDEVHNSVYFYAMIDMLRQLKLQTSGF